MPRRIALAALALAACKQDPAPALKLLGVHSQATAQPTATGKALVTLCPWQGKLYIGYGDYQHNTGPIDVTAWDPARGTFTRVHTSDTEAIYSYRAVGSSLYAPATDRRANADYAVGEPWRDEKPVGSAHAYDIATLDGTDLWLVGAAEGGDYLATAWRSTDGGAHWSVAHQPGWNGRYYFAAVYHEKLYLESWAERPIGPSEVFDGTSWQPGPELLPEGGHGTRPIVVHDRLVYATKQTFDSPYPGLAATPNKLIGFDGVVAAAIFDREVLDFFGDDHQLLALDTGGVVWRTTDLARWTRLVDASAIHPRSLAALDGTLYIGTVDAALYSLRLR